MENLWIADLNGCKARRHGTGANAECLSYLDVKVPDIEGVVFNEFASRLYGITH